MNKKRVIIVGLLAASCLLLGYKAIDYFDLLSIQKVGFLIVQDGASDSDSHLSEADVTLSDDNIRSSDDEGSLSEDDISSSEDEGSLSEVDISSSEADITLPEANATADPDKLAPMDQKDVTVNSGVNPSVDTLKEADMFLYEELTQEIKDRITGISYGDNCKVPYEELRYVKVLYWGFDQQTHTGELIVNKAIAQDIVDIFEELYEQKYPIEQMVLVDEYEADDNASMIANNSSAFNYRVIDGTDRLSNHSYGLAIDINPKYNPYVREVNGETVITPTNGIEYADRSLDCAYYIKKDDICYNAFVSRGFTWGGDWKTVKDYQHFQKKID